MLRTVASKVAWVGRTASMVFGLALVMALVVGAASTAWSATGGNFILGKGNAATTPTSLVSTLADAAKSALIVQNKSGGAALDLRVGNATTPANSIAPMKVNSPKVVTNLNADRVDGKSAMDFYAAGSKVDDSDKLDDLDSDSFVQGSGKVYAGRLVVLTGSQIGQHLMTVPGFATLKMFYCGNSSAYVSLEDFDQTRGTLSVWQDNGAVDPSYTDSPPVSSWISNRDQVTERTTWHLSVGTGSSTEAATIDVYTRATGTHCIYSATAQVWGR